MTTYILFNTIILSLLFLFIICLFFWARQNNFFKSLKRQNDNANNRLGWKVIVSLVLSILFIAFAFIAPFVFTRDAINDDFNFKETGPIGDTIGGLMNPFIAIAGVIITGLAFYIQYKANEQQRDQFVKEQEESKKQFQLQLDKQDLQNRIQQFESQFYEMLRLHRENVTEMKIIGYDFNKEDSDKEVEKITEGRKVFVTMKTEFECILEIFTVTRKLDKQTFNLCYTLFFSGFDVFEKKHKVDLAEFVKNIKEAREQHQKGNKSFVIKFEDKEHKVELNFNYKPFSGHSSRLGHYFRHLFLIVKSIVYNDVVTDYNEQMRYLKILRAQLSNHEQIFLFYNWLSDYGGEWENSDNKFFTEYCMVHNLWYDQLLENGFIKTYVDYLRDKSVVLRKGNMYEID